MSCSKQDGPQVYLSAIEEVTGEKISQTEWHAIRALAAEDSGEKLSRGNVETDIALEAGELLADALKEYEWQSNRVTEYGEYGYVVSERDDAPEDPVVTEEFRDSMSTKLAFVKNTKGTADAIYYLAENGIRETFSKIGKPPAAVVNNKRVFLDEF